MSERGHCVESMSDTVHVVPVADLISHEMNECPCGPQSVPVKREDGSVGWLMKHHSLDERERREGGTDE